MDQAPMQEEIVGLRFCPTSYELVDHYLKRKLQQIDDNQCVIPVVNIYDHDPQDLCTVYNEKTSYKRSTGCSDSFFFCPRNNTNPNSTRNRRQTRGGYWKETSKKQDVMNEKTGKLIGTKRILVFYSGKQGNAQETDLAMHEYHLNADSADTAVDNTMAFSLCHVKKKKRSKMGNSERQRSKKGNPPSGEADSSFHGEALVESQIPRTELLSIGCSDVTAGATCENDGTASSAAHAGEDGSSLLDLQLDLDLELDLDFDLDVDKLIEGWTPDEPCDPVAEEHLEECGRG